MAGKKRKTNFTKRKIKNGVPQEVMAAETKLQKDILDIQNNPGNNLLVGNGWTSPYLNWTPDVDIGAFVFNRPIYNQADPATEKPMYNAFGSFITNGDSRDERNGRRITMLTSVVDMVFHIRAIPSGDPPVYSYNINPEFRIVQGWVKGGLDSLKYLETDISGLYSEIPYSRYMIKYDKVISRRALDSGLTDPSGESSYAPFKYTFKWKPNRRITFSKSVPTQVPSGGGTSECRYDGWVPFLFILNPHESLELVFDNFKRLNLYKDL